VSWTITKFSEKPATCNFNILTWRWRQEVFRYVGPIHRTTRCHTTQSITVQTVTFYSVSRYSDNWPILHCRHIDSSGPNIRWAPVTLTLYILHGVVALRTTSERPGSRMRLSETFGLLGAHMQLQSLWKFLERLEKAWWRVRSISTRLPLLYRVNSHQVTWSLPYPHMLPISG
jgi:hypothetical protein